MGHIRSICAAAAVVLAVAVLATPSDARPYRERIVVAESHWGKGTVSGPVRAGRHGWEVRCGAYERWFHRNDLAVLSMRCRVGRAASHSLRSRDSQRAGSTL